MKIRLLGLVSIGIGVVAAYWLYHLIRDLSYRTDGPEHFAIAVIAFFGLAIGSALLTLGPSQFENVDPPHH